MPCQNDISTFQDGGGDMRYGGDIRCFFILTEQLLRGPEPTDRDLRHCGGAATSEAILLSFVPP